MLVCRGAYVCFGLLRIRDVTLFNQWFKISRKSFKFANYGVIISISISFFYFIIAFTFRLYFPMLYLLKLDVECCVTKDAAIAFDGFKNNRKAFEVLFFRYVKVYIFRNFIKYSIH